MRPPVQEVYAMAADPPAARFGRHWDWPYPHRESIRWDPGPRKADLYYEFSRPSSWTNQKRMRMSAI